MRPQAQHADPAGRSFRHPWSPVKPGGRQRRGPDPAAELHRLRGARGIKTLEAKARGLTQAF